MIDATRSTHNQEIVNSYITGYNKAKLDYKIEFIDKAREWLKSVLYIHTEYIPDIDMGIPETTDWVTSDYDTVEDFINGFIKAMEESL